MVSYVINGPILELKGEGAYGTGEITAVLIAARRDPRLPSPALLLIDIRESEINHTFADVRARLSIVQQQFGPTMAPFIAFVVTGAAREHLAQIYQTLAKEISSIQIEIFADPQTARDWLKDRSADKRA
jgi:hypothetical protein